MRRVELIYDLDCPNVHEARNALLMGFATVGLQPSWTEWDRKSVDSPPHARHYGSPTILVDGYDVMGAEPADGSDCCRIYDHGSGTLRGVPPITRIVAALNNGRASASLPSSGGGSRWWRTLASLPGVGAALLPVGTCPACWPAYAAILGSLGLGFLLDSTYLLPVTMALLALALVSLAFRAKARRGYGPLGLGIASAGFVLVFKFAYVVNPLVYAGLLGLVAASFWNAWPRKRGLTGSCPKCVADPVTAAKNAL